VRPGFAIRLAREDGDRPAHGVVLGRRTAKGVALVLAVAEAEVEAESLAGAVAPRLP
jgi:hypothetical protein